MPNTMMFEVATTVASNVTRLASGDSAGWSDIPAGASESLPPVISRSQAYYWSVAWQMGEKEALQELARGEGRRFDDPTEAIRWLLSDDN